MSDNALKGAFKYYYDTLKNGTYVAAKPTQETIDSIVNLQKRLGIKNPLSGDELHTTIMYSTKGNPDLVPYNKTYNASPLSLELFGEKKNCLVLTLDSSDLDMRHIALQHLGLVHSFDTYQPHITLTYDYQGEDYDNEYLYDEKGEPVVSIQYDGEYIEPLDP